MGNSSYYSQNGNAQTIIVHQEGAGQNCDCGPARFNFSPYHNDQRLLGHGLSEAQICGYFDGLNEYLRKNTRSPCVWICPSLLCVLAYLVLQNVTGMEEGGADEQEDENAGFYFFPIFFLLFFLPMLFMWREKRRNKKYIEEEHFRNWLVSGLLNNVYYYGGSKHTRPRLVLGINSLVAGHIAVAQVVDISQTPAVQPIQPVAPLIDVYPPQSQLIYTATAVPINTPVPQPIPVERAN